jgi:hypothetical protein
VVRGKNISKNVQLIKGRRDEREVRTTLLRRGKDKKEEQHGVNKSSREERN